MQGRVEPGERARFVGKAVEPVGENEERRRPQTDENAEAFCVGLRVRLAPVEKPPDPNRE